ncbi:tRNA (cytosine(34)-C(5))-methyltransferase [Blattella germanica]|nr:tRNA (cytosine(34)-C(5))-methyltransferase [Blattella germanica]
MGRGRRHRNRDRSFAQKRRARENKWDEKAPRKHYEDIVRENAEFEKYYKLQQICPEEEWESFMTAIKKNLPTAFRVTGSKAESRALLGIVKGKFFKDCLLNPLQPEGDNEENEAWQEPFCLPWCLICVLHLVLDMCAAPGSKTAQLIEFLHAEDGKLPTGFVIANDIDNNRCYMLVHQAKRLNSPCIIITNHDSAVMPNFTVTNEGGSSSMLKFDRVLCDVPCSGDGTLRKNPDIWLKWNAANGNNLHGIQYRILRRGAEMLAVGGRLVYSTCSLNPLENEAVMHRLLLETEGAVQLVDVSSQLPGLKYRQGLNHWLPASRDMIGYKSYDDVPEKWQTQIRPQMFPPAPEDINKFNLQRCIRILPHQQDSGGFFVAVIEKVRPLPWEAAAKTSTSSGDAEDGVQEGQKYSAPEEKAPWGPQRKKRKIQGYKEDPFIFFTEDEPLWPSIRDFYGIDSQLRPNCLLTRCKEGKKKNIYFTSPAVRDIVVNNQEKIKGLHSIFPFIGPKRKVKVTKEDLIKLLTCENPKFPPETSCLDASTQKQITNIEKNKFIKSSSVSEEKNGETMPLENDTEDPEDGNEEVESTLQKNEEEEEDVDPCEKDGPT